MPKLRLRGTRRVALLLGLLSASAVAQEPPTPPAPAPGRPELTAQDLEAFLDGIVPVALKADDIAGAVVAVVKDGQLLLAKGYGFADVERKLPVRPDSTLFRVASISKLFTATAVMQQVEQGALDLDADVGTYLDFELPRRFPDKITLRHLLTHTAGFEESFKQLPTDSGRGVPLREWVSRMTPAQIYRPGTVTSYSNYGNDLAGYVVERVSGTSFPEYVRLHILEPLGMMSSSFAEPLPAELRSRLSKEYPTASDSAGEFEVLLGEPSGNLSATATDMARFALAHLALGQLGDRRILGEETARLMATTQFRTHPNVPGMGLGFFEESRNGYRIIGHGGDLSRFHSHLSLLMDEGVGFFVSVNSAGRGSFFSLREAVRDGFLDRYFPRKVPLEPVMAGAAELASRVAGPYTLSRRGETTFGKITALLINLDVEAERDGALEIPFVTGPNGQPIRWYPIDSTTYRNEDGSQRIGFVPAAGDLPDRIAFLGGHELHRVAPRDSRSFSLTLLAAVLGTFAAALILWPVAALVRRRHRTPFTDDGAGTPLRTFTRVAALCSIAFMVGFAVFMTMGMGGSLHPDSRSDPVLGVIRLLGVVGVLGIAASAWALIRSMRVGRNGWARVKYVALLIAGIGFAWFTIHWNLLAWSFRY